jgi:hypothetical protein
MISVKGNHGRATQKARTKQAQTYMITIFLIAVMTLFLLGILGGTEVTKKPFSSSKKKSSLILASKPISTKNKSNIDPILKAEVHLINIHVSKLVTKKSSPTYYDGIEAEFCVIDWNLYNNDPWKNPLFRDLVSKSEGCKNARIVLNLKDLIEEVRRYDQRSSSKSTIKSLDPNFIFHESHCGSTLLANALAYSKPQEHRVYSESGPPISALRICGENLEYCTAETAETVFRDVVYLMSRVPSNSDESHLFFKMQSSATSSIQVLQNSFPKAPWVFVYRDPEEVMVSQLNIRHMDRAKCVQSKTHPPHRVRDFLDLTRRNVKDLSNEEYCALYLSSICNNALDAIQMNGISGKLLNYENLIEDFITDILPNEFGVNLDNEGVKRIEYASTMKSKSRDGGMTWVEDSAQKHDLATDAMHKASTDYLAFSYIQLEDARKNE